MKRKVLHPTQPLPQLTDGIEVAQAKGTIFTIDHSRSVGAGLREGSNQSAVYSIVLFGTGGWRMEQLALLSRISQRNV